MNKIFKKALTIAGSVLMVGSTIGLAAAAAYPAPFVENGAASVAIVYGSDAAASDKAGATTIQSDLSDELVSQAGTSAVTVSGDSWQVKTSSDFLELGESIADVETYIGNDELELLADEEISNEKGVAKFSQYLYFNDAVSSSVNYTEDDDDNVGLFFKVKNGAQIARYVMDFSTALESDIETDNELSDIEDKDITFLGKTYTIVNADNRSGANVDLTLMSGALKRTIGNDEEITLGDYTVTATVSSATQAQFTINGETTDKMVKGDLEQLSDGNYLAVTDITYQDYAGGIQQATFYLGADKIELKNGSDMTVNAETINNADVIISSSVSSGDISITEISINMIAEDDLFVPVGGKLSEATDLDEPEVLVSQNWDIVFEGLEDITYEEVTVKSTSSDSKYQLSFENYNGDDITLPLLYTNTSGVYGGEDSDKVLVLSPNKTFGAGITKNDYFILNTGDPTSYSTDSRSFVVQYKGSDSISDTDEKVTLDILGVEERTVSLNATGGFDLKLGGTTFTFRNLTDNYATDDVAYALNGPDYHVASAAENVSVSNFVRTKHNALINITDTNASAVDLPAAAATDGTVAPWNVYVTLDDQDRDGDELSLSTAKKVLYMKFTNASDGDVETSMANSVNAEWLTDAENSDKTTFINSYGVEIESIDTSTSPAQVTLKIPESVVKPLVYVTSSDAVVGGSSELGDVTYMDSESTSYAGKNLVVVGGSAVNSVAAELLGGALRGDAFEDATGVGAGEFLIQSFSRSGKTALLVAGYNAADTTKAVTALTNEAIDTTVGKKYVSATVDGTTVVEA